MDKDMYEQKLKEVAEDYAWAIVGGLSCSWEVPVEKMREHSEEDMKFVRAQFIFVFRHLLEEMMPLKD
jgi:hypothetical protein